MSSGRSGTIGGLPERMRELVRTARRGVMTTIDPDGSPHSVPVVYAVVGDEIVSPIDHKPKSGRTLMRVKNLHRDARVTLLVDVWDEDWPKLGWCMVRGQAVIDPSAPAELMQAINARYPQYRPDEVHDALIRIRPTKLSWWTYSSE
ncbi:MAG: pyridoxamine 5'-phosphate oxidase family protein [Actinomycetota bacterium]|nr:pyridoxamine 5'-phosphate oxidase family protein [Actinomycetota bacterium]